MDYVINSDILIFFAQWIGTGSLVVSTVMIAKIALLNRFFSERKRRAEVLREQWLPVLIETLDRVPDTIPELKDEDILEFLILWNYLQESIRDENKENLNIVARRLNLDLWAIRGLGKRNFRNKLLAIQTLGWLREDMVGDELIEIMKNGNPVVSLSAARALTKTHGEEGIELFINLIAKRKDWSFSMVGKILREAGADLISYPLVKVALSTEEKSLPKLLRFFELVHPSVATPTLSHFLRNSNDPDVISYCLRATQSPNDLPLIREMLKHENWRIRAQAARCLGRIGTKEDEKRLAHAAGDQQWWVRYRAAQALASLPSTTVERLREISMAHYNPYATDVIDKVIGESQIIY